MKHSFLSLFLASTLMAAPVLAQTTEAAPDMVAAETAPAVVVEVPEGYILTEPTSVTADEMKGLAIYDPSGTEIAKIADLVIGDEGKVTGIITDVGGFLGLGEHRISLSPDQVVIYKNADNDLRAYVSMTKDELKALPKYEAPNP